MKIAGSYPSLLQGVSEQIAQQRSPGRLGEQVNMLPDPVEGLIRRRGTKRVASHSVYPGLPEEQWPAAKDAANQYAMHEYSTGGKDYILMLRKGPPGPTPLATPPIVVYCVTDEKFLTVVQATPSLGALQPMHDNGLAAWTTVGKYLFAAPNGYVTPGATSDGGFSATSRYGSVWIRNGVYDRKYSMTVTCMDGFVFTVEYTTPQAQYPGSLDTSDIPATYPGSANTTSTEYVTPQRIEPITIAGRAVARVALRYQSVDGFASAVREVRRGSTKLTLYSDIGALGNNSSSLGYVADGNYVYLSAAAAQPGHPDNTAHSIIYAHKAPEMNPTYSEEVAARTAEYNAAVTAWIRQAAERTTPEYISGLLAQLASPQIQAHGGVGAARFDTSVVLDGIRNVTVDDGGNGEGARAVGSHVSSVEDLVPVMPRGKVVAVTPKDGGDSFYMKAVRQDGDLSANGWARVRWEEGAKDRHTIGAALVQGCPHPDGNRFILFDNPTAAAALLGETPPTWAASRVGDSNTQPQVNFVGKQITYLGVFQNRLLVGAGSVLSASRTGKYLDFYRTTTLSLPADDAFEVYSQGNTDDTLRYSVLWDKDLILFGDKRQYVVSGTVPMIPTNANMAVLSQHKDTTSCQPVVIGDSITYGQSSTDDSSGSVHQIRPSSVGGESPESFNVGTQLGEYIRGRIRDITPFPSPQHVLVRTSGHRHGLYVFSYLDKPREGRVQDAWHRFDFNPHLGEVVGCASLKRGVLLFYYQRHAVTGAVFFRCDFLDLAAARSDRPYLDAQMDLTPEQAAQTFESEYGARRVYRDGDRQYHEYRPEWGAENVTLGYPMASYFEPTNPWVRDRNDNAITTGRFTVTSLQLSCPKSSGFIAEVMPKNRSARSIEYTARTVGDPDNIVGRVPVVDLIQSVPIGAETREYTVRISARSWLPFAVSAMEYVGQFFNRQQRV